MGRLRYPLRIISPVKSAVQNIISRYSTPPEKCSQNKCRLGVLESDGRLSQDHKTGHSSTPLHPRPFPLYQTLLRGKYTLLWSSALFAKFYPLSNYFFYLWPPRSSLASSPHKYILGTIPPGVWSASGRIFHRNTITFAESRYSPFLQRQETNKSN